jgi:hypothetical protein
VSDQDSHPYKITGKILGLDGNNIKMDVKYMWEGVFWIDVAQDVDKWRNWYSIKRGEFVEKLVNCWLPRTLLFGVSGRVILFIRKQWA